MNYFRAILQLDERSERAWDLTEDVIDQNPANYTAWYGNKWMNIMLYLLFLLFGWFRYYRRLLLTDLKKDLDTEMEFCAETAESSPKNYQVWLVYRIVFVILC